jgi:hypothetical protein
MATEKTVTKKAPDPDQLERESKVIALRSAGATWAEIAKSMGYAGPSSAYYTYQKAAERLIRPDLEEYRDMELERLDRLQRAVWRDAIGGNTKAVDSVLRIIDRRSRLLGLDQPTKIQAEVITYDAGGINTELANILELIHSSTSRNVDSETGETESVTD